jgi:hypothetical protein
LIDAAPYKVQGVRGKPPAKAEKDEELRATGTQGYRRSGLRVVYVVLAEVEECRQAGLLRLFLSRRYTNECSTKITEN